MYGLDLFSGIGGLTKALEGYVQPIAYCENDRYAQSVLLSRMASGDLPLAPIWNDIKTINKTHITPPADIVYGGFPCQDISTAGCRAGLEGERSGLFFEVVRIVGELRPAFVFLENVSAITVRGAERVVGELCRLRYDCRWGILSASDMGAPHRRDRWWLLAHRNDSMRGSEQWEQQARGAEIAYAGGKGNVANAERGGRRESPIDLKTKGQPLYSPIREEGAPGIRSGRKAMAYPDGKARLWSPPRQARHVGLGRKDVAYTKSLHAQGFDYRSWQKQSRRSGWWAAEPHVGRVAHGIPARVDRLKCLGNAVVPAQAREAFERLMGLK